MRHDGRQANELREVRIERHFLSNAQRSVLISFGNTRVLCSATLEDGVPRFLKDTGKGWVTAEYAMLPTSTHERMRREITNGKPSGRTMEIQRLIGRSLRAAIDLNKLGERSVIIDCDVIQADGGTRTTAINGGMIVLYDLVQGLVNDGQLSENPIKHFISAVSLGIVNGHVVTDLNYIEDSSADVDLNLVMTEANELIEIQGTAEETPFNLGQLNEFLTMGWSSIQEIIAKSKESLMVSA